MRRRPFDGPWRFALAAACIAACVAWSRRATGAEGDGLDPKVEYTLTIHRIWGSSQEGASDLPRALRDLEPELERCTRKKRFRSSEEATTARLKAGGKPVEMELPDGYKARWSIEKDEKGRWSLRQVLVNPKGDRRSVRPSKSPVIVELGKITRDGATLILVVELASPGPGAPGKP